MSLLESLALLLILGCTCEAFGLFGGHGPANVQDITLNDGPANGNERFLFIQEGAVVDLTCKSSNGQFLFYSSFSITWGLGGKTFNPNAAYPVDHDTFPVEFNKEQYHSELTDGYYLSTMVKPFSTLRYTAREEDNGKFVYCYGENGYTGAYIHLIVRPAPAPLTYKSTIVHKWGGGFVGEINIPISDYYNSWKIILKFGRKVFDLKGGHFQIANEPCLHGRDCGDDRKNTWVIYNTFANRVLNPGDHLKLSFIARVWKKMDQGVVADVDFYGYEQVFHTDAESAYQSSSSDIHVI